jgi:hypothetical protein
MNVWKDWLLIVILGKKFFIVTLGNTDVERQRVRLVEGSERCQSLVNPEVNINPTETSVGATIADAVAPVVSSAAATPATVPSLRMTDVPMQYSSVVEKWYKVGTYQWTTVQTAGGDLVKLSLPLEAIEDQQLNQPFTNFAYWRGDVELRVVCNSTPWHKGLLKCCWAPSVTKWSYDSYRPATNLTMLSNLPGGYIHANAPVPQTMMCNFVSPLNYISTAGEDQYSLKGSFGVFGLHVFEPLEAGAGTSTSVDVTIFVRMPNSEFHLALGLPVVFTKRQFSRRKRGEASQMFKAFDRGMRSFANTVETSAKSVSRLIPIVRDALDVVTSFDHGYDPSTPILANTCNIGYLNCVDQPVKVDKLAIDSRELAPTNVEHFSTSKDECEISYLLRAPSFFKRLVWQPSHAAGTALFSGLITPTMYYTNVNVASANVVLTPMDWISLMMRFWRGPLDIHIKLVTTSFVTGTLRFSVLYGSFEDTVSDEQANSQYFYILDLKDGQREYDLRMQFPSNTTLKQIMPFARAAVISTEREKYCCGMFYVHVVNALAVSNGSPTDVAIHLFCSGEEVQFFGTARPPLEPAPPVDIPAEALEERKKRLGETDQSGRITLGTGGNSMDSATPLVRIVSVRDLARRQYLVETSNGSVTVTGIGRQPSQYFQDDSMLSYMQTGFAGRRGGLRWKLPMNTNTARLTYWDPRGADAVLLEALNGSTMNLFQHFANDFESGHEVETSFTCALNYLSTEYAISNWDKEYVNEGTIYSMFVHFLSIATFFQVFLGGADDFRFGIFLGPAQYNSNA